VELSGASTNHSTAAGLEECFEEGNSIEELIAEYDKTGRAFFMRCKNK